MATPPTNTNPATDTKTNAVVSSIRDGVVALAALGLGGYLATHGNVTLGTVLLTGVTSTYFYHSATSKVADSQAATQSQLMGLVQGTLSTAKNPTTIGGLSS